MNSEKFNKIEKDLLNKINLLKSDNSDKGGKKLQKLRSKLIKHRLENQHIWKDSDLWY
tara:strand:+ start:240 stop:413 length:174 start_codon:yes stop_codon:yes gene_type:complete